MSLSIEIGKSHLILKRHLSRQRNGWSRKPILKAPKLASRISHPGEHLLRWQQSWKVCKRVWNVLGLLIITQSYIKYNHYTINTRSIQNQCDNLPTASRPIILLYNGDIPSSVKYLCPIVLLLDCNKISSYRHVFPWC